MERFYWKILLVEDDEDDYLLTRNLLSEATGGRSTLTWVKTFKDALSACSQEFDAYLVDYRLGAYDGLQLVRQLVANGCRAPVIVMTGQGSYDVDVEAMKAGAIDYMVKGEVSPTLLERTIRYAIERKQAQEALRQANEELEERVRERTQKLVETNTALHSEIVEREQAQQALSKSEARFRQLTELTSTAIFIVQGMQIRYANPAATVLTGYTHPELLQMPFFALAHPAYQTLLKRHGLANPYDEKVAARYELKLVTKNQQDRWADITAGPMEYEGRPALVLTAFDITERDQAEKALKKAKEELEVRVTERTAELRQANQQLADTNQQLQAILQAMPVGVWVADAGGNIIETNEMGRWLWGATGQQSIANIHDFRAFQGWLVENETALADEDWPLSRAIRLGQVTTGELIDIQRPDGRRITLAVSAAPFYTVDGQLLGAVSAAQDVTLQRELEKQARAAAAQAEQRAEELDATFAAMSEAVIIYDASGQPRRANPAVQDILGADPVGLSEGEVWGRLAVEAKNGGRSDLTQAPSQRARQGENVQGERITLQDAKGTTRTINVSASPIYTSGRLAGAVTVWHDITELEKLLTQLEDERARLDAIIANAPEAIVVTDHAGRVVLTNPAAARLYAREIPAGEDFTTSLGAQLFNSNGSTVAAQELPLARSVFRAEMVSNQELLLAVPGSPSRNLLTSSAPIINRMGQVTGAIAIFQDITDRKQAEAEMRQDAARIEVQRHLIQYREMERLDIAQDLHDGPIQEMIGLAYNLSDILQMSVVQECDHEPLAARLHELQDHLRQQIRDLRVFCSELRPPTLTPFGLEKAIRSHAEAFQARAPALNIVLDLAPDGHLLPEKTRLALFRIYQEMLNNVNRHARATQVEVRLKLDDQHVVLELEDNGCGFELPDNWLELARQGHLGLVGAQERAEAVGGTLTVESQPGVGTRVHVEAPLTPSGPD